MTSLEGHRLLSESWDSIPSGEEESSELVLQEPAGAIGDGLAVEATPTSSPPRSLTYLNGLALVVGFQIGSGIFSAPAVVLSHVISPFLAVLVWFVSGLLVWTGAASFIELGIRVPLNGGMQEYLRHCYGDLYGFLFAWIWLLVSRPCAMAMVSLVFSEYLFRSIWVDEEVSIWLLKGTAFVAIVSITYLNCIGTRAGAGAANFFLVLKVGGLGSIAVVGFAYALGGSRKAGSGVSQTNNMDVSTPDTLLVTRTTLSGLWMALGRFTDAILAALFAYGGWDAISFVIGEMKDPYLTLPRVLHSGMAISISLFVLANVAIYNTLSLETLEKTNAVAIAFGVKVFGRPGAIFYACVVGLSCLGALNAIVFSAGRLTQAAGARQYLPAFLNAAADSSASDTRDHRRISTSGGSGSSLIRVKKQNTPMYGSQHSENAMVLNALAASVYLLLSDFRGLLSFKAMIEYVVYLANISGLLLLRFRPRPEDKDGAGIYRTPIFNPIVFCSIATLMVVRSAITHPVHALIIVLILGTGSLVYRSSWWRSLVRAPVTDEN